MNIEGVIIDLIFVNCIDDKGVLFLIIVEFKFYIKNFV